MAKRMKFSVVGLPHYTIWHLYEPSADDIKHMERMEEERKNKERQEMLEREKQEQMEKQWDSNSKEQWEKDQQGIQKVAEQEAVAEPEKKLKKVKAKLKEV